MLAAAATFLVAAGLFFNIPMCRYRNETREIRDEVLAGLWFAFYLDLIGRFFMAWISFNLTGWHWEHYIFLFGGLLLIPIWVAFLKKYGYPDDQCGRDHKWRFSLSFVYQYVWAGMTVVAWFRVSWHLFS